MAAFFQITLKMHYVGEHFALFIEISLKYVSKGPINNKQAVDTKMPWPGLDKLNSIRDHVRRG